MTEFVNVEPPDRPRTPSRQKLCEEIPKGALDPVTGLPDFDEPPYLETEGFPVQEWLDIVLKIHPTSPRLNDVVTLAPGWGVTLTVWRYMERANDHTQTPEGGWYVKETLWVSLDGDPVTHGGPMDYILPTYGAEKMFIRFVDEENRPDPGFGNGTFGVGAYGHTPRPDDMTNVCLTSASAPPVVVIPGPPGGALLAAPGQNLYSNLYSDFSIEYDDVDTLYLRRLRWPLSPNGSEVYAISRRAAAAGSAWTTYYRGGTLRCTVGHTVGDPQFYSLTISPPLVFAATDEIIVWLEGPPRGYDMEREANGVLVRNPDCLHNACDGIVFAALADADDDDTYIQHFYFDMALSGYHRMSLQTSGVIDAHPEGGIDSVKVYGTNQLDPDIDCLWSDITLEAVGTDNITGNAAGTAELYMSLCDLPVRRIRITVTFPALADERAIYGKLTLSR